MENEDNELVETDKDKDGRLYMMREITVAAFWWSRQLINNLPNNLVVKRFYEALKNRLLKRFKDHWYPDNQIKGSAYRSISYDRRMDPILVLSAQDVGLLSIEQLLSHMKSTIMYINPSEVKITQCKQETNKPESGDSPPNYIYIYRELNTVDFQHSKSPRKDTNVKSITPTPLNISKIVS